MARDVVQILSCDRHAAAGEVVSGIAHGEDVDLGPEFSTVIITEALGYDGLWKELDWCKPCRDEPISPNALRQLWEERGIDVEAPKRKGRPPVIPKAGDGRPGRAVPESAKDKQCLWCVEKYAAESGFSTHLQREHGLPKSMIEVFGSRCPLCGEDGIYRLTSHCKQQHSVSHVSQAFIRARGSGDEFGVVKTVEAKATKVA